MPVQMDYTDAPKNILYDINKLFLDNLKIDIFKGEANKWKAADDKFRAVESKSDTQNTINPNDFNQYSTAGNDLFSELIKINGNPTAIKATIARYIKDNGLEWQTGENGADYNIKLLEDKIFNALEPVIKEHGGLGNALNKRQQKASNETLANAKTQVSKLNPGNLVKDRLNAFVESENKHTERLKAEKPELQKAFLDIQYHQNLVLASIIKRQVNAGRNAELDKKLEETITSSMNAIDQIVAGPVNTALLDGVKGSADYKNAQFWTDRADILNEEVAKLNQGPGMLRRLFGASASKPNLDELTYALKHHSEEGEKPSGIHKWLFASEFDRNTAFAVLGVVVLEVVGAFVPKLPSVRNLWKARRLAKLEKMATAEQSKISEAAQALGTTVSEYHTLMQPFKDRVAQSKAEFEKNVNFIGRWLFTLKPTSKDLFQEHVQAIRTYKMERTLFELNGRLAKDPNFKPAYDALTSELYIRTYTPNRWDRFLDIMEANPGSIFGSAVGSIIMGIFGIFTAKQALEKDEPPAPAETPTAAQPAAATADNTHQQAVDAINNSQETAANKSTMIAELNQFASISDSDLKAKLVELSKLLPNRTLSLNNGQSVVLDDAKIQTLSRLDVVTIISALSQK